MEWKERRGTGGEKLETYKDFEKLYGKVVREFGWEPGPAYATEVIEGLHRIYLKHGYDSTLGSAKFIARFEKHDDEGMKVSVAKMLSDVAYRVPLVFGALVKGLQNLYLGENAGEENRVRKIVGVCGKESVILVFISEGGDRCIVVGDTEEAERMVKHARDYERNSALANRILDFIGGKIALEGRRKMELAERNMGTELNGNAADIIDRLRK